MKHDKTEPEEQLSLVESIRKILMEEKDEYQKFFDKTLDKYGVDSPEDLSKEKKKEFFDYIDKNWKGDDEQQNESKNKVEIKKSSTDNKNVSKRDVTYDVYVNGKFDKHFKDIFDAEEYAKTKDPNFSISEQQNEELEEKLKKDKDDPCWAGYVQLGMKKKNGKEVPNCVPMEEVSEMTEAEMDEKKMSPAAKKKAAEYRRKNKQKVKKYQDKYRKDIKKGTRKVDKKRSKSMKKSRQKSGVSEDVELEEKAKSQAQQKLMGMAYALKKGEMDRAEASDEVKRLADTMDLSDLEDFASTKHKDLPNKKESVELEEDYGQAEAAGMAETQLHFIKYAAEEVLNCIEMGMMIPEWYQNQIAKAHGEMEGIHSYMEGKKRKSNNAMGVDYYESTELEEAKQPSDNDLKDLSREIDDIDEIPNSIKQSLKNGELPSKRDVQTIDSEWAQDAFLVSMSELIGAKNVEKMYGMKVINPDAL